MGIETAVANNVDRPAQSPPQQRPGISRIVYDFLTLLELQIKLVRLDAARSARRALVVVVLVAAACAIGIAGMTTLLTGLGEWIATTMSWPTSSAFIVTGSGALLIAVVAAIAGLWTARSLATSFQHSAHELQRNIDTLKRSLADG